MFSYRPVRRIESHAEALASQLDERMHENVQISHSSHSCSELSERVYEIYRRMADWLLGNNELDMGTVIAKSAPAGPPRKLLRARSSKLPFSPKKSWDFVMSEAVMDRAIEIMGELERLPMLERCFLLEPFIMPLWGTKKELPVYCVKAN